MTTKARGRVLALLLTASGLALGGPASADDVSEARQAAQRGTAAFKENRFEDALRELGRAEDLVHAPTHLLMMARTRLALGGLIEARRLYREVVAESLPSGSPAAFARAKKDAEVELAALEPRIPQIRIQVSPADAKGVAVFEDDKPLPADAIGKPRDVDPGSHAYRATADGMRAEPITLSIAERGKDAVQLDLAPNAKPAPPAPHPAKAAPPPFTPAPQANAGTDERTSPLRPVAIGALAFGSAGLALGLALLPVSKSKRSAADAAAEKCAPSCTAAETADARRLGDNADSLGTASTVGLVAGGTLLAGGFVLLVASAKDAESAPPTPVAIRVRPTLGFGSVGASGTF